MKVFISAKAYKELNKLPELIRKLVIQKIENLAQFSPNLNIKKLSGRDGLRLRVGDYRIIYKKLNHDETIILSVKHRKDAYRQ